MFAQGCDAPEDAEAPPLTDADRALLDEGLEDDEVVDFDSPEHEEKAAAVLALAEEALQIDPEAADAAERAVEIEAELAALRGDEARMDTLVAGGPSGFSNASCQLAAATAQLAVAAASYARTMAHANWSSYGSPYSINCYVNTIWLDNGAGIAKTAADGASSSWSQRSAALNQFDANLHWADEAIYTCAATDFANYNLGNPTTYSTYAYELSNTAANATQTARDHMSQCFPFPWF